MDMKFDYKKFCAGCLSVCMLSMLIMPVYAAETTESFEDVAEENSSVIMDEDKLPMLYSTWAGTIEEGNRCYYDADGHLVTGLQVIDEKTYYFNTEGVIQTGWQCVGEEHYYFAPDTGERYEDRREIIDDVEFFFNSAGKAIIVEPEETKKEENQNSNPIIDDEKQNKDIDEKTEDNSISNHTKTATGWQGDEDKKYYVMPNGQIHTGWLSFGQTYYYCGKDGFILYGKQKIEGSWYYFNDAGIRQQSKWIEENGEKRYYALSDGKLRVGWLSFGSTYYYCGSDGAIAKDGIYNIDGVCYYFNEQGIRQKLSGGWKKLNDNKKCYIMPDGKIHTGWLSFGKTYYYCGKDGLVLYGKQKIGGDWYYFNNEGVRQQNKWIEENGEKKYYALSDGKLRQGWLSFGSTYYYCGSDGAIVKNRTYNIDGVCYYFNEQGIRQKLPVGWKKLDNDKKCYTMPDGKIHIGWLSFGKTYYYCGKDGLVLYGKQKIGGDWYYFNNEGVRQQSKWIEENGEKKYYALSDGKLRIGWLSFGNTYYYCKSDGAIVKGQTYAVDGVNYYFNEQGIRQKWSSGWVKLDDKKKYYVMPNGKIHTGWLSFGQTYYYCGTDGLILYGKQMIGNNWYYFNEQGIRQQNQWVKEDGVNKYYAFPDGKLHTGWLSFGSTYYYCEKNAEIIRDQIDYPVDGVIYTFDTNGIMKKESGWGTYGGNKYYKNPETGLPFKNQWVSFGQTYYYANSKGHMVSGWQMINGYRYYFDPATNIMARNTEIDGWKIGSDGKAGAVQNLEKKINEIKTYTYVPYVSGGTTTLGWDCSGFTMWALKYLGVNIPRLSHEQAVGGVAIDKNDMSKWKPGDILVYSSGGYAGHVALYLGDGKLMHSLSYKWGTLIQDVNYYEIWDTATTLTGVRRYF